MLLIRFAHYMGMSMWIGGGLAVLILVGNARGKPASIVVQLYGAVARMMTLIVAPGVFLTLASGILWSMALAGGAVGRVAPLGLWVMSAAGFVGGLLVLFAGMPAAVRMKAVAETKADGTLLPIFERQKSRLVGVSYVAGAFALVALLGSVLAP